MIDHSLNTQTAIKKLLVVVVVVVVVTAQLVDVPVFCMYLASPQTIFLLRCEGKSFFQGRYLPQRKRKNNVQGGYNVKRKRQGADV